MLEKWRPAGRKVCLLAGGGRKGGGGASTRVFILRFEHKPNKLGLIMVERSRTHRPH